MCTRHTGCTTERGEVICNPYITYSEVTSCNCIYDSTVWNVVPLQPRTDESISGSLNLCHKFKATFGGKNFNKLPKTLYCHDLKGGYLEDRFVNGSTEHDEYRFFHWAGIDTFVYFSHHFITIPPPVWISAAHLHGVTILGTVITEWKDGEAIWKEVLSSDDCVVQFADRLVNICSHFSFDGYLLNVENFIDKENIPRLEMFVKVLSTKLKQKIPHGKVVWYDSVTINGKLDWQDQLNDMNRTFFDNCDGIFLNYCWNDEKLKNSVENAGSRKHDVYVGVDVFGRGCFGGGGFNTSKAMEVVRAHGLSVALFAPSWVHEVLGKENFVAHEYVFWQKLWPFLYLHGPQQLPFSTSFCQGFGNKLYHCGTIISDTPWYNLSKQQYQPSVASCLSDKCIAKFCREAKDVGEGGNKEVETDDLQQPESYKGCVQHYQHDGFCGGGCLEVTMPAHCKNSTHTILVCNFECDGPLLVTTATKRLAEGPSISLLLAVDDVRGAATGKQLLKLVNDETSGQPTPQENEYCIVEPVTESEVHQFSSAVELLKGSNSWIVRYYVLKINGSIVKIGAELEGDGGSALLGYLSLSPLGSQHEDSLSS